MPAMRTIATLLSSLALVCGLGNAQPLTILTEDAPPLQFIGTDGQLTGYAVEVVREIQRRVGNKDEIKMLPWARAYQMALTEPNVALFLMSRTGDRNALFQWIGPLVDTEYGLYAKADSPLRLRTLEDAKKLRRIGVYRDDVRDQMLTKAGFTNLDRVNNNTANVQKLMSGRIDLYASSSVDYGNEAVEAGFRPADLKLILPFSKSQLYVAVSLGTPAPVVNAWEAAFKAMRQDGSLYRLLHKHFPEGKLPGPPITNF
jgi:polar amino acid transport system substrate-binding protein